METLRLGRGARWIAATAATIVAVVACDDGDGDTSIAVITSEESGPLALDELALRVEVLRADGARVVLDRATEATSRYDASGRLRPWTVVVRPETERDVGTAPYRFRVEGRRDGAPYVIAQARVAFVGGLRLTLPLRLSAGCAEQSCGADQTCENGECRDDGIASCELAPMGTPCEEPRRDAGPPPIDAARDEDASVATDARLDEAAAPTDATTPPPPPLPPPLPPPTPPPSPPPPPVCSDGESDCGGVCVDLDALHSSCDGTCDPGWQGCDDEPGCETQLGTLTSCNDCRENCAAAHLTTCTLGVGCEGPCEEGWAACGSGPGCDTQLGTLTSCNDCGENCAAAHLTTCTLGVGCEGPCAAGWSDCGPGPGCETEGLCPPPP